MRSDRLLATLLLLQTHGRMSAPDLARRLEVSTRTVARDVEALSAAGVPVYVERGRRGGVVLMPGFRTDVSGLTDAEMRALLALTDGEQGGSLGRAVASAVRKLLAAVPETRRGGMAAARRTVVVEQHGWHRAGQPAGDAPALADLERAVTADERVRIRYRPASGEAGWRTVDPYGLVSKAGTWYLVAAARGTPRMFRVSRVEEVAATGTPARRPDDRGLEQVWVELRDRLEQAPEAVTVRVRVDPARRAMVERVVAAQLVGPPEPDGHRPDVVRLPFRAPGAAVGILLGLGATVEVLGPPEVRTLMAARAADVVALYG